MRKKTANETVKEACMLQRDCRLMKAKNSFPILQSSAGRTYVKRNLYWLMSFLLNTFKCSAKFSFAIQQHSWGSRGSSGSIVSDYGLDDRVIEVRSWQGQKVFLVAPASRPALRPTQPPIQWVPGVLSPGVKRGRGVTLTTYPHLVAEVECE
jgi:hypothetical protein